MDITLIFFFKGYVKKVKIMVKEMNVSKGCLKINCKYKDNDKINLPFHIHVSGYGKGVT